MEGTLVGLFWDVGGTQLPEGVQLSHFASQLATAFKPCNGDATIWKFDVARAFVEEYLQKSMEEQGLGDDIEIVPLPSNSISALFLNICMWLWDVQRLHGDAVTTVVVLVTEHMDIGALVKDVKMRCTSLYLVANDPDVNAMDLIDGSVNLSDILKVGNPVNSADEEDCNMLSSGSTSIEMPYGDSSSADISIFPSRSGDSEFSMQSVPPKPPVSYPFSPMTSHKHADHSDSLSIRNPPQNVNMGQQQQQHQPGFVGQQRSNPPINGVPGHGQSPGISSLAALASEDASLFRDFKSAFDSKNVGSAVAALRRIYPKQNKQFRIPELLSDTIPSFSNPLSSGSLGYLYSVFLLKCAQWCFGLKVKRKGESVDSFKYNMNKMIANWLMQALYEKMQGCTITPELKHVCVDVLCLMMDNVCELDFALEIMQHLEIANCLQILTPYLQMWQNSDVRFLALRANVFAAKVGSIGGESRYNSNLKNPLDANTGPAYSTAGLAIGSRQAVDQNANGRFVPQAQQATMPSFDRNSSDAAGDSLPAHPQPRGIEAIDMSLLLRFLGGASVDIGRATIDDRLVAMVVAAPEGLLGSKIPYMYFQIFNERLDLRGRKLTDVLIASEIVFVCAPPVGSSDRLFKATNVHRATNSVVGRESSDHLGYPIGPAPLTMGTRYAFNSHQHHQLLHPNGHSLSAGAPPGYAVHQSSSILGGYGEHRSNNSADFQSSLQSMSNLPLPPPLGVPSRSSIPSNAVGGISHHMHMQRLSDPSFFVAPGFGAEGLQANQQPVLSTTSSSLLGDTPSSSLLGDAPPGLSVESSSTSEVGNAVLRPQLLNESQHGYPFSRINSHSDQEPGHSSEQYRNFFGVN